MVDAHNIFAFQLLKMRAIKETMEQCLQEWMKSIEVFGMQQRGTF